MKKLFSYSPKVKVSIGDITIPDTTTFEIEGRFGDTGMTHGFVVMKSGDRVLEVEFFEVLGENHEPNEDGSPPNVELEIGQHPDSDVIEFVLFPASRRSYKPRCEISVVDVGTFLEIKPVRPGD